MRSGKGNQILKQQNKYFFMRPKKDMVKQV